jgi:long-chain fatty acid transport protein
LGLGVNAPFGLKTEYNDGWVGRYNALKSDLKTININPTVAFKLNDQVSLGAGVSYQRIEAELTKAVDFGSICVARLGAFAAACTATGLTPTGSDGKSKFQGDDWSWGYNLGAIIQATPSTRIGLSYRSEVRHELEGRATISGEEQFNALLAAHIPAATVAALKAAFPDSSVKAKVDLPATISASIFHQATDKLDLMADITWTGWSSFESLRVVRTSGALSGATLDVQPEKWQNTRRYSIGASYRYDEKLKLRTGVAYDESPVSSSWLTPRIPDSDRTWLSFGANYKISETSALDVGYTHLFVRDRSINTSAQAAAITALGGSSAAGTLKGDYNSDVNIVSAQFTHTF